MKWSDREFSKQLKSSCPKTPEHFQDVVRCAVEAQNEEECLYKEERRNEEGWEVERRKEETGQKKAGKYESFADGSRTVRKRRRSLKKRLLLPAAAALLVCSSAIALGNDALSFLNFDSILEEIGIRRETAEKIVETDAEVIYGTEVTGTEAGAEGEKLPLVAIKDVYLDGSKLIFSAAAGSAQPDPEYGKIEAKDHAKVNGLDCMVQSFTLMEGGTDAYTGIIELPEGLTGETLDVQMRLYTDKGIEEFSFEVGADHLKETRKAADQTIEIDGGRIEVTDIRISPSGTGFSMHFTSKQEKTAEKYGMLYLVEDSSGKRIDTRYDLNYGMMSEAMENTDGSWGWDVKLELKGFDCDSEYIKLIPYIPETNEEGVVIPDTGTIYEEDAILISLKEK